MKQLIVGHKPSTISLRTWVYLLRKYIWRDLQDKPTIQFAVERKQSETVQKQRELSIFTMLYVSFSIVSNIVSNTLVSIAKSFI